MLPEELVNVVEELGEHEPGEVHALVGKGVAVEGRAEAEGRLHELARQQAQVTRLASKVRAHVGQQVLHEHGAGMLGRVEGHAILQVLEHGVLRVGPVLPRVHHRRAPKVHDRWVQVLEAALHVRQDRAIALYAEGAEEREQRYGAADAGHADDDGPRRGTTFHGSDRRCRCRCRLARVRSVLAVLARGAVVGWPRPRHDPKIKRVRQERRLALFIGRSHDGLVRILGVLGTADK